MKNKTVYRSKIDWWVWCVVIMAYAVLIPVGIGSYWWLTLIYGVFFTVIFVVGFFGCWYEIEGADLIVYQFFRPHHIPISKMKEVKYTRGYLATAGMSLQRVSIKFIDRSVMKSYSPLEISPKDRDGFCKQLQSINPQITVIR